MTLKSSVPTNRPVQILPAPGQLPPPQAFGLGPKFSKWRAIQEVAILAGIDSPKRFVFQAAPTGSGKSAAYVGQALLSGARTCILTATKGLQSQLITDFEDAGMVDVRGMNAYICNAAEDEFGTGATGRTHQSRRAIHCHEGMCRAGLRCSIKDTGCDYYTAVRHAKMSNLVVTNYAFWMTKNQYSKSEDEDEAGLGKFDLLVLDEGHHAPDELSGFLQIELEAVDVESTMGTHLPDPAYSIEQWRDWGTHWFKELTKKNEALALSVRTSREAGEKPRWEALRQVREQKQVLRKLKSLAGMRGEWVAEVTPNKRGVQFDPVWPSEYAESVLFRGIPKVVIFSATIRPKTAAILGIDRDDYEFLEYPSDFPIQRRPIFWIPTVRMDHRATPDHIYQWMSQIDRIIGKRLDRKGIIHTTSYTRRNQIMQNSEYHRFMISHDPSTARSAIERFKRMEAPAVLVSPSVSTGYDFPGDECRYQIIGKLPFPDSRSAVMKARQASDKDYGSYMMTQNLVQMVGRGMRSMDDWCETFIIDDHWEWVQFKFRQMFPAWFLESCQRKVITPPPPSFDEMLITTGDLES